jgi:hypothetical protein
VLLVFGVVLLIVGVSASNSVADQVSNTLTGRFTQATTWYIVGGVASAAFGLFLVLLNLRRKLA